MLALIVVLHSELWETRYELQSLELFGFLNCIFEYESADKMVLDVFFFAYVKLNYVIVSVSLMLNSVAPVYWVSYLI